VQTKAAKEVSAPFGNKFALGLETSGRPPVYSDPKMLIAKIEQYFEDHLPQEKETEEGDKEIIYPRPVTITGLCLYLGFDSRQSFYDYEKKDEFSYIIKRARLVIESMYEENLTEKAPAGSIFALKNMDWSDKSEIDHNVNVAQLPDITIKTKNARND
jgi:hypothetical protein